MKVLLDTHTLLSWLDGDERLASRGREWIGIPTFRLLVSAASAWEIAIKVRIGKLSADVEAMAQSQDSLIEQGFSLLEITTDLALAAGGLPGPHLDPFDRTLIAQARSLNIALLNNDSHFDPYGI